jgi:large subunit ribosomal protein L31
MKAQIHPKYFQANVVCSCGTTFTTGSTIEHIKVEVCSKCHPYFTGEHRLLDTKGRAEVFQRKQKQAADVRAQYQAKKTAKAAKGEREGKSLRELLGEA